MKKYLLLTIVVIFGVTTAMARERPLKTDPVAGASVGAQQRMERTPHGKDFKKMDPDNRADSISGASAPLFEGKYNKDYHEHHPEEESLKAE